MIYTYSFTKSVGFLYFGTWIQPNSLFNQLVFQFEAVWASGVVAQSSVFIGLKIQPWILPN